VTEQIGTTREVYGPDRPDTIREMISLVDRSWERFHDLAVDFPAERLDEHIGGGWTRKQMLAHIAAWHDLTTERLTALMKSGEPHDLEEGDDVVNARVARAAAGRTAGEVFDSLETSFRRLRRQLEHLSDGQLVGHGGWAQSLIAANTYDHYQEHRDDLKAFGA
jgi:hypothetical protein